MMLSLLWKEFREHRAIFLTMVFMTGLLAYGMEQLLASQLQSPAGTVGISVFAMAAVYGVVCGSMMLAGERESGTLVFLDVFLGRRGLLWTYKMLLGVALVILEGLAVAAVLSLLKMSPPEWIVRLLNQSERELFLLQQGARFGQRYELWFLAVPMVTLEAYGWGLLASSWTHRVLASAGVGILMGFFVWWITILIPPPASLVLRLLVLTGILAASLTIFRSVGHDAIIGALPPPEESPRSVVLRELAAERYLDRRDVELARHNWGGNDDDIVVITPVGWQPAPTEAPPIAAPVRKRKRREYAVQAESPRQVLWWLTWRQGWLPLLCMSGASFLFGFFVPAAGGVLWPLATLLLGVGCGTATFAWEQSDLSYQFLAAQHFPLKTIRNVKLLFWSAALLAATLLLLCSGTFSILMQNSNHPNFGGGGNPRPVGFEFGTLLEIMGPVLFFGVWLGYGFTIGQLCVLYCRKTVYAVVLGVMTSIGTLALWMPSLLCRGMGGWQLWLTPLGMLLATRWLLRAWAGGRLKERKPMAALVGIGSALLLWLGVNCAWRAWEIPDVGAPLDREDFKQVLTKANENPAGQRMLEVLVFFDSPGEKKDEWVPKLIEAARLPPGILEAPSKEGHAPTLRHLSACKPLTKELLGRAGEAMVRDNLQVAVENIGQILALSRNLRCKAPTASYLAGVEIEGDALEALAFILADDMLPPEMPRRILTELDRHVKETPPPRDAVEAECYRAGGLLQFPASWDMRQVSERWIINGVAMSMDTPWEAERVQRLWQAVWAGLFRAVDTPHWQFADAVKDNDGRRLQGWLPANAGRGQELTHERLQRFLDESWLHDGRLFAPVSALRSAGNRSRWRVEATRLAAALAVYQAAEGKTAQQLNDLTPKYLPELPVDPYSGKSFLYRLSKGEVIEARGDPQQPAGARQAAPGQAILWSTGPDGVDHGGRKHGGALSDNSGDWERDGFDLVTIVPRQR